MQLNLPNVTGVFVDGTGTHTPAIRHIVSQISKKVSLHNILHFSTAPIEDMAGVTPLHITPLTYGEYSNFCLKSVYPFVLTDFSLWMQTDGFIVNPDAWTDEFLQYDYVGCPWPWLPYGGNGGFSLRSQKLMKLAQRLPYTEYNEDVFICQLAAKHFLDNGCLFAPNELGVRWGMELEIPDADNALAKKFGFHSKDLLPEALRLLETNF